MSGGFRVLHVVRPFLFLLPEVQQAGQGRKVPFREKALYTTVALAIFLVCSQCVPVGRAALSAPRRWRGVVAVTPARAPARGSLHVPS
jgi:protein transport protein SEC61 subunit alpha